MLSESEYSEIRSLLECERPLIFMHDDPDGLSSFLLLQRYMGKGNGVLVKTTPVIDSKHLNRVVEFNPDKIFIVDIAVVEQSFIDGVSVPIVWIDHHTPLKRTKVKYFNPRIHKHDAYFPATYLCYRAVEQDMWIAMVGCVGDWFLPEFAPDFAKKYPDILDKSVDNPDDAMFKSKLGRLVRLFSFVLKGKTEDAMKSVKMLTKVESPYDLLEQRTADGKFLWKRYEKFNKEYEKLLNAALSSKKDNKFFVFRYKAQTSFSSDLANEILYRNPDLFLIIGRERNGEVKMSLRSRNTPVLPKLKKALEGLEGAYGGGHEYACGASVPVHLFEKFESSLRVQLK
jgi:single-stranded DNA-specific DHH superfamily exonuclease